MARNDSLAAAKLVEIIEGTAADMATVESHSPWCDRAGRLGISVGAGSGTGRVVLVGFDPQHTTAIGSRENGGRTLTESNIVRSVRIPGAWTGQPLTLDIDPPSMQEVAVLLEAPDGAARL